MSTTVTARGERGAPGTTPTARTAVRSWRPVIVFAVGALVALVVFAFGAPDATATFRFSESGDAVGLPDLALSAVVLGWLAAVVCVAVAVLAFLGVRTGRPPNRWLTALFWVAFLVGFLTWVVGSARTPNVSLAGLLAGSVTLAVPLIFGSLSGVLCERAGVVNIAIEGQLLFGAFSAAVVASVTRNAYAGLLAACAAGALVAVVLAVFSIKYYVNQIIVGVVLNVLVSGLTGFLFSTVLTRDAELFNSPPQLPYWNVPLLADIPVLGPILFRQTVVGYLMYVAVVAVYVGLFHTRWGLRVRAVGEHPRAADTVGIKVNRTRFTNVLLGGVVAGLGGAFFTLVSVSQFTKDMTGGQGFIALAALIFGRWNPVGAFFAALLFGFATNLQYVLSFLGTPVPSQFLAMLPYLVTILAVAGLVGRSQSPAASGVPYLKG